MDALRAPPESFFCTLELRRIRALVDRDLVTFDALHAPAYQLITPAGKVFTREAYREALAAEAFYAGWQADEMQVRVTPQMALVRYQAHLNFPSGRVVHCWHTDSYEREGGGWQAVWSQATLIAPATAGPGAR